MCMTGQAATERSEAMDLENLGIAIDRRGEVPIGVQIAWAIRARLGDGTLRPGQRLPGLRELAEATGVNANTVRAVYQRLEQDGLITSLQGSGTFVTSRAQGSSDAGRIAAGAAREAYASGIDPRDVAAALYASPDGPAQPDDGAERRGLLRMQISALELALGEIEAEHPGAASMAEPDRTIAGPRLLGTRELEAVRGHLLRRLAALQSAVEVRAPADPGSPPDEAREAAKAPAGSRRAKSRRSPRATPRTAPAS